MNLSLHADDYMVHGDYKSCPQGLKSLIVQRSAAQVTPGGAGEPVGLEVSDCSICKEMKQVSRKSFTRPYRMEIRPKKSFTRPYRREIRPKEKLHASIQDRNQAQGKASHVHTGQKSGPKKSFTRPYRMDIWPEDSRNPIGKVQEGEGTPGTCHHVMEGQSMPPRSE